MVYHGDGGARLHCALCVAAAHTERPGGDEKFRVRELSFVDLSQPNHNRNLSDAGPGQKVQIGPNFFDRKRLIPGPDEMAEIRPISDIFSQKSKLMMQGKLAPFGVWARFHPATHCVGVLTLMHPHSTSRLSMLEVVG